MPALNVRNEFGRVRTAMVHRADNFMDIGANEWPNYAAPHILQEHPETKPVSKSRAIQQQKAYLAILSNFGIEFVLPETQDTAFCQVFTRDPCFVVGNTLFVGSLGDSYRQRETLGLTPFLQQTERKFDLRGDGSLIEGGDVMVLQDASVVLVGMHRHTNAIGFDKLRDRLQMDGIEAVSIPHKALHLDCCFAPLPDRTAFYAPTKLPDSSRDILSNYFDALYPLDIRESEQNLAANLFWLDINTVVSSDRSPKTNAMLRDRGYEVYEIDFSELIGTWGSFRCVTCPIYRE